MFRLFNKNAKVYVLNGGLPRWEAEKRPLESGESKPVEKRGSFYVNPDYSMVRVLDQVMDLINDYKAGKTDMTVIDTRPKGRFDGTQPEPRPGLTCGHMPGSIGIPFSDFSDPSKNFQLRSKEEIEKIFKDAGVDIRRKEPIVFSFVMNFDYLMYSCGSGNTACVGLFAAHLINRREPGRYFLFFCDL